MKKLLFSIFDRSGNSCEPYRNDPDWTVVQIDLKHGIDVLTWDYVAEFRKHVGHSDVMPMVGLIFGTPCTDYALSGARHFARKDADAEHVIRFRNDTRTTPLRSDSGILDRATQ